MLRRLPPLTASSCKPLAEPRAVRSFVRREGRLTCGQQRALKTLWGRYGVDLPGGMLDLPQLFGREAPTILEIGFGSGEVLARLAADHPESNYLGIEVHRPGIGCLLLQLEQAGLTNMRLMVADAAIVLRQHLALEGLDQVYLFFPDPWPKKRHHKRRLVQPEFAAAVAKVLRPGGLFYLATDWADYANHMLVVMMQAPGFVNTAKDARFTPRPEWRPQTRFEIRGRSQGHPVWDLAFARI